MPSLNLIIYPIHSHFFWEYLSNMLISFLCVSFFMLWKFVLNCLRKCLYLCSQWTGGDSSMKTKTKKKFLTVLAFFKLQFVLILLSLILLLTWNLFSFSRAFLFRILFDMPFVDFSSIISSFCRFRYLIFKFFMV